jgi:hypothetical protein
MTKRKKRKTKSNLREKAMLVNLTITGWTGRVKDKKVSNEVCLAKHSNTDSGAWWTYLVPKDIIATVQSAAMKCRMIHFKYTLPWMDGGIRILAADMFMKYSKEMRKAVNEYNDAVDNFLLEYPTIVKNAKKRLGNLYENRQLPSASEIKPKFAIHQDVFPIPQATDFRCHLDADEVETIRDNITKSVETLTEKAMSNLWEQFAALIEKIEKTMRQPKKIFRDSLIENLSNFCELIPKMNLTQDNNLEELRKEAVKKLAELKPIDLRESRKDRRKAHKSAKEIMEKIKGYTKQ